MISISSPVAVSAGRKRPLEPGPDPPEHIDKHPRTKILAPSDKATDSRKRNNIDSPPDGDHLRRLHGVNRSVMNMLDGALNKDPNADLSTLLKSHAQVYPSRRKKAEERALKALTTPLQRREPAPQPEPIYSSTSSCTTCDPTNPRLSREAKRALQAPSGIPRIITPLAPPVLALLESSNVDDASPESPESSSSESIESWLPQLLGRMIAEGDVLRHISGKVIVRLSDSVVIKLGTDMDLDQAEILTFVAQNTKTVPVPEPLGALKIEDVSYMFLPHIKGRTLEMRWPTLTREEKHTVQANLDSIMEELRQIPPPPDCNLGWNDRCKDTRWCTRQSGPIVSEKEFNDFLLSNPLPRTTKMYLEMMRSRLRDDHKIVLTHGNLHPRNIMVADDLTITGLIGWEMGGWYPEYWENLKALNTLSATGAEGDDWWQYMPKSIGLYHAEWALDCQLETLVHLLFMQRKGKKKKNMSNWDQATIIGAMDNF